MNEKPILTKENKNKKQKNKKTSINIKTKSKSRYLLIYIFLFSIISELNFQNQLDSNISYVTLKFSGAGNKRIFYDKNWSRYSPFTRPNEVFINEIKQDNINYSYNLNNSDIVKLVWKEKITGCECMFMGCDSIIEMNFTNFDISHSKSMQKMFSECESLISLDLSSFDTSNVEKMNGMFRNCHSLISLNITNFNASKVLNMGHMFYNCRSLTSIDISHLNISKAAYLDNMFNGCSNLSFVNLSNVDTSNARNISKMFNDCLSLTSIDISHFVTSEVIDMSYLFNNCISLTSINISNFNTRKTIYMNNMFNNCTSLKFLFFENIDITENMTNKNDMFLNCDNLEYINLNSFKSSEIIETNFFVGTSKNLVVCTNNSNLIDIIENYECITINCFDNWYDYKKKINTENNSCTNNCSLTNYKYEFEYKCYPKCLNGTYNNGYKCEQCHPDCEECEGPPAINNTNCKICSLHDKFLNLGNCINECKRDFYINQTIQQKICICDLIQCYTCSKESFKKNLCTSCDVVNGYYPLYDASINIFYPYFKCDKSPEGYYFDEVNSVYKLCYFSCKTCGKKGNSTDHNCLECKYNYKFELYKNSYKNCYEDCPYFHFYEEKENKSICTTNLECPKNYDKLIEAKNECVFNCEDDDIYKYEFRKKCYKECPSDSTKRENSTELNIFFSDKNYFCKPFCNKETPFELISTQKCVKNCPVKNIIDKSCILNFHNINSEEKEIEKKEYKDEEDKNEKIYDIMLDNIEIDFTSNNYNFSFLEQGNNDVIELDKMTVTLTTIQNQKKDKTNTNVTTIDLGNCEYILKKAYNISDNEILFMKKVDVIQEGMKIPKVEYDVYHKLNDTNLMKLNLSHCVNTKIEIFIPVKLTESIDILNSSSGYYNDLCYTATSESGTDITLNDRKKEFIENNKTLCQENCVFSEYNYDIQKAKCTCEIFESSSSSFSYMKINKTKLYENFIILKILLILIY